MTVAKIKATTTKTETAAVEAATKREERKNWKNMGMSGRRGTERKLIRSVKSII